MTLQEAWPAYYYFCSRCDELETALLVLEERYKSVSAVRYDREPGGQRSGTDKGLAYVIKKDELTKELKSASARRIALKTDVLKTLADTDLDRKSVAKQSVCRLYFVERLDIEQIASALYKTSRTINIILKELEKELQISRKPEINPELIG